MGADVERCVCRPERLLAQADARICRENNAHRRDCEQQALDVQIRLQLEVDAIVGELPRLEGGARMRALGRLEEVAGQLAEVRASAAYVTQRRR